MHSTDESSTLARFFLEDMVARPFFTAGFSTRCHSSLLKPHPGGALREIWYASRVGQLAIHEDGAGEYQSTVTDHAVPRLPTAIRQ